MFDFLRPVSVFILVHLPLQIIINLFKKDLRIMIAASVILLSVLAAVSDAFYLPGVAPHSYTEGENVELKVNKLR